MNAEARRKWALELAVQLVIAGLATDSRAGITFINACEQLKNLSDLFDSMLTQAAEQDRKLVDAPVLGKG
jgi:hypothetical protein